MDSPFAKANDRPSAKLIEKAAKIGGAQHSLLLNYGFTVVRVTENTAVYLDESDGYQITLDAVGHWWIKPEGGRELMGIGFVDLEAVLSPGGRWL